jgi:DNA-binding response OmpR family regulator
VIEEIMSAAESRTSRPVLYVEDEENDVILVRTAMKRAGIDHPLNVVTDGRQAVDYLQAAVACGMSSSKLPCIVLLDLNLPRLSGLEVLEWVRKQHEFDAMPIVIFTSSELEADRVRARQLGADDYLVKPSDMFKLWEVLGLLRDKWIAPHCGTASPRQVASARAVS